MSQDKAKAKKARNEEAPSKTKRRWRRFRRSKREDKSKGPGQEKAKVEEHKEKEPAPEKPKTEAEPSAPAKVVEGAVEGTVSTTTGPLANATVWYAESKAVTDAKGRFLLEHIPAGSVTLKVTSPTPRFQNSTMQVTVTPEKKADVFIFLGETVGTLEGEVKDESGNALAKAQVSGLFRATEGTVTVNVDEKGHYSFKDVPPGSHFIRASAPGFMIEGKSVEVVGAKSTTCGFALKQGALSLTGKVADPEGQGVDSEVYLLKRGIVVTKVNTKAGDGTFSFRDLISGNYELTIVAPGYAPRGWMGKLEKDETMEFRLER